MIFDNHNRPVNYLRLSVTDRCNLRCTYCMPANGIIYLPRKEILTYEEMERLVTLLVKIGVNKVRITGGEPFLRKGLINFLKAISSIPGLDEINITTNGVLTEKHVPELKKIGIAGINLSLDTTDAQQFKEITRRDEHAQVMASFHKILEYGIPLKLNAVIMEGINTEQIIPLAYLSKKYPIDMRYIEEMPFNGTSEDFQKLQWNSNRIFNTLQENFDGMTRLPEKPNSTSMTYKIPGHAGTVGIIAGFSRLFCGTCNRLRITAKGTLKTCLYDDGVLDLQKMLRSDCDDLEIQQSIINCIGNRFKDGFEAQENRTEQRLVSESMSEIGG